jgi:hypothetical protein
MNWQRLFVDYILDRGYDYYCDQKVEIINIKNDMVEATVFGSDEYDVEINYDGDGVSEMYCSCPHAAIGNNCKHMAAVLFAISDNIETFNLSSLTNDETVAKLVADASEDTVRKYLITVLEENEKLRLRFKNIVSGLDKDDLDDYKHHIDRVVKKYLGRDNFINYYEASDFYSELSEFLDTDIGEMIDNKNFEQAFELTNYIFVLIGNIDIDDSGGETSMLADECFQIWEELLENANINLKRKMFNWFLNHLDGSIIDYNEGYIEMILMDNFSELEFIKKKFEFSDLKVKNSKKINDDWSSDYNVGKWAVRHLDLMDTLKKAEHEQVAYCKKYWDYSNVRKYYIDKCMENKDYQAAIEALKESQQIDKNYRGLLKEHSVKLKEIYLQIGNQEAYINQLWQLILKDNPGDLDIYKELKNQYTDQEWKNEREKILSNLPRYANIDILYAEEKLYDRLLAFVQKSNDLYALYRYEDILVNIYPQAVLEKYQNEVEKLATSTSNRKIYQNIVAILRKMIEIPSGNEIVENLVSKWKHKYSNRKAMMDELKKL